MQFIDVTTDFAFKKVFGSQQSKEILISFLNALLDFGKHPIVNLTIVDPYQAPLVANLKNTYVDIKAYLDNGTQVIIEMQVLNHPGFDKRVLSNVAKAYSTQLEKGEQYSELNPAIALTFTDFVMFSQQQLKSQVITDFIFLERQHKVPYPEEMRLVFVELPKFEKTLRQLKGMADKWIYFVKHVGHLKSIPKTLGNDKEIKQALNIANTATLTPEELEVQQKKLRWLLDQKANLARLKGLERENAKAQKAAQEALYKALKAENEKQAAFEKLEAAEAAKAEKQAALYKAEAQNLKAENEKQAAFEKLEAAEAAKAEKQAALDKMEAEKQAILEKAELEKQKVAFEKQTALEKAKNAEKTAKLEIAKQLLQANADMTLIRQVTGLKKMDISKLK
jgi:predicted transposase/invertase (TIGR01784 family)